MRKFLALGFIALIAVLLAPNCEQIEEPGAPRNLALTAVENGVKVKLSWDVPSEGTPDGYIIYFKELGGTTFDSVGAVTTTEFTHDPAGKTGTYKVAAYIGDKEAESGEKNTIPVSSSAITVAELNAAGSAGFGFDITTGNASTWSMTSSEAPTKVDFYVTDFASGSGGSPYYIASSDIVISSTETGKPAETPSSGWRVNGILLNPFENATDKVLKPGKDWTSASEYAGWQDFGESSTYGLTINYDGADLTGNYYYAYIVTGSQSGTNITISTIYFQMIPNLRLLKH